MARRIMFANSGLWKYSWAHLVKWNDWIMPMSDAVSSESPKATGIQQRYSTLSLMHRDFSGFSESLDDVMHCRWWDLQSPCNFMLRNVVFKVFHNLFTSGGPLSALTCCVNVRLLSAIKQISPLIYSQSWVGSWVYTTQAMMTFTLIF